MLHAELGSRNADFQCITGVYIRNRRPDLAEVRLRVSKNQWRALVDMAMCLRVSINPDNLMTS